MSRVKENENDQAGELRTRSDRHKVKSSLPKRSEVHQSKKKKSKVKIKFPMIKLLSLFFILLPIGFYSLYTYLQDRPEKDTKSSEVVNFSDDEETIEEAVPTTATAGDIKEKEEKDTAKLKEKKQEEDKAAEERAKKKAKQEAEAKAKAEAEVKAKQEAEAKAKAEAEAKAKQEAEAKAKAEAEAKAKQEADNKVASGDAAATKSEADGYKVVYHTVQAEETLFRIAMNYYKSQEGIALIQKWNGLNGNEISKGQVLKIPLKK
ncbi:LysM peptidoglycan-binding domain-containing protein [Peribacillus sp. NPDC097264]|uniref:LysM peptidoglycan-binding domain-containing protein n=1 Tax=unclassified Peribacillus TaxID=2675266 RepID=UPI0038059A2D